MEKDRSFWLCLEEKLAIVIYKEPGNLLNKRFKVMTKCKHENSFLQ